MCAGAQLISDSATILQALSAAGLDVPAPAQNKTWNHEIWGFGRWDPRTKTKIFEQTPAIIATPDGPRLSELEFSLTPAWARAYPLKASTYNARLNRPKRGRGKAAAIQTDASGAMLFERVYEYPAYRAAWQAGRFCLVPLSAGIESSYAGEYDQQRFAFFLPEGLMFLLGLWDEWQNPASGETHRGFTLFTSFPQAAMRRFGHHREVVQVDHTLWPQLLDGQPKTKAAYDLIITHRLTPDYQAQHYANLKTRKGAPETEDFFYPPEDLDWMGEEGRIWLQERMADRRE